jgi:ergothioneine biosynthesis protein EgtB
MNRPAVLFSEAASENASAAPAPIGSREFWLVAFRAVRAETETRAAPLSAEDQTVQSMADASPAKWHRAHTTWFFEEFLLRAFAASYRVFDDRFSFLFNSYYVAAGPRYTRSQRGLITRPDVAEVGAYRAQVDAAVMRLLETTTEIDAVARIIEVGLNHEQQHQELMLTDILHVLAQNPTAPAYDPDWRWPRDEPRAPAADALVAGIHPIGHQGSAFCFDNERPAHQVLLEPVRVGRALVTNGAWLEFMADGGYSTPSLWLSDGWAMVEAQGWSAPGYWRQSAGGWLAMTLGGLVPIDPELPVCHVSYYEADAFARWSGKHLPSEAEWETAARAGVLEDAFGKVWQWTRSAYAPYPGYKPEPGALGEYNGKFMINQMVLRGSSVATPAGHSRETYRNFFYPSARWQFSGLRLADFDR